MGVQVANGGQVPARTSHDEVCDLSPDALDFHLKSDIVRHTKTS